ncbi:hypothetical protein FB45DRAFT_1009625 [Roridomyces roridus]|uniref:Uncharacterized protein n=1 Tax=Roridomyces roridus TaxID=1738132 RepID=A0AAD7B6Z0_9AGAR|nr:hypothetical protein FB45DRAFT_1009625 [Roridomyces roridus]
MREEKKELLAFVVFCPNSVINQHHVFSGRIAATPTDDRVASLTSLPHPSRLPLSFTVDDTGGTSWITRRLKSSSDCLGHHHHQLVATLRRLVLHCLKSTERRRPTEWASASVRGKLLTVSRFGAGLLETH